MERINIAELLKDCPRDMELDCTIYDGITLFCVDDMENTIFPIRVFRKDGCSIALTKYGQYADADYAKCVIFPKGKTTWEGFVPPCKFKDGDVLVHTQNGRFIMSIYKSNENEKLINTHVIFWDREEGLSVGMQICCYTDNVRFATKEEKAKLFQAIKDNGYKWNANTNTLEKLPETKFQVGDKIKHKDSGIYCTLGEYSEGISAYRTNIGLSLTYKDLDDWELVPNKFKITNLVPFESRVLVRNGDRDKWRPAIFGDCAKNENNEIEYYYALGGTCWRNCIPYEDNEHLRGTTDDCNEFYKY